MASTRIALSGNFGWILVAFCWAFLLHDLVDRVTSASDPSIFYALGAIGLAIGAAFIAITVLDYKDPSLIRVIGVIIAVSLVVLNMIPADNLRFLLLWFQTVLLVRSEMGAMKRDAEQLRNGGMFDKVSAIIMAVLLFYLQWRFTLTDPILRLVITAIPAVLFISFWRPVASTPESEESPRDPPVVARPGATFILAILWGCAFILPFAIARVIAGHFENSTFLIPVIVASAAAVLLLASACAGSKSRSRPRSRGVLWGFTIAMPALVGVPWIMATSGVMLDTIAAFFHVGALALVPFAFTFIDDARVLLAGDGSQKTMLAMIVGASLGILAGIAGILFGAENYLVDSTVAIAFTALFLLGSIWTSAIIDQRKR